MAEENKFKKLSDFENVLWLTSHIKLLIKDLRNALVENGKLKAYIDEITDTDTKSKKIIEQRRYIKDLEAQNRTLKIQNNNLLKTEYINNKKF